MADAETQRRAAVVAGVAQRLALTAGVQLPGDLRLWDLAGGRAESFAAASRVPVGTRTIAGALETTTAAGERRSRGLHVTPEWLADRLVARAVQSTSVGTAGAAISMCDPACGGGVFLLAAARLLHARGMSRVDVVRRCLWGADVDPVGLAAAEASLALWAGEAPPAGRLVVGDTLADGWSLWPDRPGGRFDLVAGNPPFLSQLASATARSRAETRRLRERFGDAVRAYTDSAWLFLLLACELARPGGRVVLVQPESLVAARDATAVRRAIGDHARLVDLWVDDRRVFAANVRVCAPILEVVHQAGGRDGTVRRVGADEIEWRGRLADGSGVPRLSLSTDRVLGQRARVVAGFRDEYYGLVPAVRESADRAASSGTIDNDAARLVTSGSIDWARCAWGDRPIRFAKRRWGAPVVDLARLSGGDGRSGPAGAARRWVEATRGPKVLVATQTRVLEVAIDETGAWVPSVPVIAVLPAATDDLWRIAAAVASPSATAWAARRSPGTALARDAIKLAARELTVLPLPVDDAAWDTAAVALRAFVAEPSEVLFEAFVAAAAAAYDATDSLVAWWRERGGPVVRRRRPPPGAARSVGG